MTERVLPRAARERWLKPHPEPLQSEGSNLLNLIVQPILEGDVPMQWQRFTASEYITHEGVRRYLACGGTPSWTNDKNHHITVSRIRIYDESGKNKLYDGDLLNGPLSVGPGLTFEYRYGDFVPAL